MFAAGNLVHAAETADIAALSGRHAARHIAALLARQERRAGAGPEPGRRPRRPGFRCWWSRRCGGSRRTRSASAAPPPLGRFVLRSAAFRRGARLEVRQDGRLLARSRPARLIPGRPVHLGAGWLAQVDPAGGPVRVITGAADAGMTELVSRGLDNAHAAWD